MGFHLKPTTSFIQIQIYLYSIFPVEKQLKVLCIKEIETHKNETKNKLNFLDYMSNFDQSGT